jgi:hypothetical protein
MKSLSLLTLFASGSLAAMGTAHRRAQIAEKIARRGPANLRTSNALLSSPNPISLTEAPANDVNTDYYSSNWAGAAKSASGFTYVTADTTVPVPSIPPGGSSSTAYYASAWVGIDGYVCETAILQTGIDVAVQGSETAYDAWYEWYPDYAYTFDIEISAGDQVSMTVDATSKKAGTATIKNLTTGKSVTHTFSAESDSLCETDVEWIVERFAQVSNGQTSLVPFADFGSFTFTGAQATQNGATVGLTGSDNIAIQEDGEVVTQCTVESDTTLYCEYIG